MLFQIETLKIWFLANLSGIEEKKQGCGVCQSESVDIDEVGNGSKTSGSVFYGTENTVYRFHKRMGCSTLPNTPIYLPDGFQSLVPLSALALKSYFLFCHSQI